MGMYRDIIKSSWHASWHHKYLWIFGIFASIFSAGGAGAWALLVNNYSVLQDQATQINELKGLYNDKLLQGVAGNIFTFLTKPNALSILAILAVAIFLLLFVWLAIVSQGSLISGASRIINNEKTSIEADFRVGNQIFFKILGLQVLARLATYGSLLIIGTPLLALYLSNNKEIFPLIFSILSFVLLMPLGVVIFFILLFASIYVVIQKMEFLASIERAWHVFKNNWLSSLEFAFMLFIVNLIAGFCLAIILVVPLLVMVISNITFNYVLFSTLVVMVLILLTIGMLTTFQFIATVHFIKVIDKEMAPSRIVGWLTRLFTRKKQANI